MRLPSPTFLDFRFEGGEGNRTGRVCLRLRDRSNTCRLISFSCWRSSSVVLHEKKKINRTIPIFIITNHGPFQTYLKIYKGSEISFPGPLQYLLTKELFQYMYFFISSVIYIEVLQSKKFAPFYFLTIYKIIKTS